MAKNFIHRVEELSARHGYPISDIGGYLQPIEHNRACHLEFNFFKSPSLLHPPHPPLSPVVGGEDKGEGV